MRIFEGKFEHNGASITVSDLGSILSFCSERPLMELLAERPNGIEKIVVVFECSKWRPCGEYGFSSRQVKLFKEMCPGAFEKAEEEFWRRRKLMAFE